MKFIISLLLTILLAFVAGLYMPWWGIALAAFVASLLIHQSAGKSFLTGFTGLLLLWTGLAWWMDTANESILSSRVVKLLPLPDGSVWLILFTGLVAGLVGGMAALTAHFLRARKTSA